MSDPTVALSFKDTLHAEGHKQVVVPETYARYKLEPRAALTS